MSIIGIIIISKTSILRFFARCNGCEGAFDLNYVSDLEEHDEKCSS